MKILEVNHLKKIYVSHLSSNQVEALSDVTFSIEQGEYAAIMGESGSGKTTLLNLLASLDRPTAGEIIVDGQNLASVSDRRLAAYRRENLGFVFQDFNLLDTFTIQDNIFLPLVLSGKKVPEMKERLEPLAKILGILDILKKYPYEVSGGQKQRAAAARALITDPKLLLADEPTGALDSKSSKMLLERLQRLNQDYQTTILMVTHDAYSASYAKQVYMLSDGAIKCRLNHSGERQKFYDEILSLLASMGSEQE